MKPFVTNVVTAFKAGGDINDRNQALTECFRIHKELSANEAVAPFAAIFGGATTTTIEAAPRRKPGPKPGSKRGPNKAKAEASSRGRRSSKGDLTLFDAIINVIGQNKTASVTDIVEGVKHLPSEAKDRKAMVGSYLQLLAHKRGQIQIATDNTGKPVRAHYCLTDKGKEQYQAVQKLLTS